MDSKWLFLGFILRSSLFFEKLINMLTFVKNKNHVKHYVKFQQSKRH